MKNIKALNSIYLATCPIFGIYKLSFGVTLDWILIFILFVINLFSFGFFSCVKHRLNEVKWFASIIFIGFIGAVFNMNTSFFDMSIYVNNCVAILFFFTALIFFTYNCDVKLLGKILVILGVLASSICVFQRMQLLLTGNFNNDAFFIPGLELTRDLDLYALSANRPSAFFLEPAHLAIFLLPIFNLTLYLKKIYSSVIIAVGILFSGSTTGFILLFIMLIAFQLSYSNKIHVILTFFVSIILGIVVVNLFPDVIHDNILKLQSADSQDIRHLGPLQYLHNFNTVQCLTGIGLNQLENFLKYKGLFLTNEWGQHINANYANAVIYMLISYGVVGFAFFIKYLNKTIRQNRPNIGLIIYVFGILLSDQVLFNRNLLYLLTFLLLSSHILATQNKTNT